MNWASPKKLRIDDPRVTFKTLTSHPSTSNTDLDDFLAASEPEVATTLPSDVKNAEKLVFNGPW